ncbi:uncharacterized protein LOC126819330 isoform X1 [Patella vulgata]|uniref:uncharacterized protein LOC126819330 isoform X1 n=1 Tax=Patella vulgata TaxID=6465 RepID=UPI0021806F45|nr:uncharacterized protein LOC126819330 isoform X1 [Patella vulgata]XP_050403375.1 uncharacterized protein LOC126819330 isoform X1 [Patella vulgata]
MDAYGGYGNLGKNKMEDNGQHQQFYQPSAKKMKVEYSGDGGVWQQPEGYGNYNSYYDTGVYGADTIQPQNQQPISRQTPATSYGQSGYDTSSYDNTGSYGGASSYGTSNYDTSNYDTTSYDNSSNYSYGAYTSYYKSETQPAQQPSHQATYECPLYDKSNTSSWFGNGNQQQQTQPQSTQSLKPSGGMRQGSGNGFSRGGQVQSRSSMSRGGQAMRGNRGSTNSNNSSSFRGTGNGSRGYNNSSPSNRGRGGEIGRFSGMTSRGAGGGPRGRGGPGAGGNATRGSGSSMRGGSRGGGGRGGSRGGGVGTPANSAGGAKKKWETLPGGQTRPIDNKAQPAATVHKTPKPEPIDATKLPLPEKIRRLSMFLRGEKREINEIMLFENSLMSCKVGIRPDFLIDDMVQGKNGSFFTGRLNLDGVFLARAIGSNKKGIKLSCFKKAVELCRTLPVSDIMSQTDLTPEVIKEKLENLNSTVAKVEKETIAELPTPAILKQIQDILTNPKYASTNSISKMELAASVAKCRVRCRYDVESCKAESGKVYHKGMYFIDNILQGAGVSVSKKTAKSLCYNMVVERLTTMNVEHGDILDGVKQSVIAEAEAQVQSTLVKAAPKPRAFDLREKFVKMNELISAADPASNIITVLDGIFNEVKLTPICLYRRSMNTEIEKEKIFCNLYLAGRLIIIGEAENRTDAQADAYSKAREVLTNSDPEFILTQHSKLQPHDQAAPDVIDFRVKGNCILKDNCTNLHRLQRTRQPISTLPAKDIVVFEHVSWKVDRKVQGFCILQHSCFVNNMLLEWEFFDNDDLVFRCQMKIQKEDVGTEPASSVSKIGSRNLAAADILFKLYETQPVIEVSAYTKPDQVTESVSFDTLLKEAEVLKKAAEDAGENVTATTAEGTDKPTEEPATEATETKTGNTDVEMKEEVTDLQTKKKSPRKPHYRHADRFILKAAQARLDEFIKVKTLKDLLFGPAFPHHITRQINGLLRNLPVPVRFMVRSIRNQMYTIVTQSMSPIEIVAFLKANGGQSGRFRLVEKSELPTHNDILPELKSGEIKPKKDKSGVDNFFEDVSLERTEDFHTAMSLGDNSAYAANFAETTESDESMVTPKKENFQSNSGQPNTSLKGNTSTPIQGGSAKKNAKKK